MMEHTTTKESINKGLLSPVFALGGSTVGGRRSGSPAFFTNLMNLSC